MTAAVQRLIATFDALPDAEKHEAAVEILRRAPFAEGDLTETELVSAADALFLALDEEESRHAKP